MSLWVDMTTKYSWRIFPVFLSRTVLILLGRGFDFSCVGLADSMNLKIQNRKQCHSMQELLN